MTPCQAMFGRKALALNSQTRWWPPAVDPEGKEAEELEISDRVYDEELDGDDDVGKLRHRLVSVGIVFPNQV